jgi:ABC-type transport system involved in cytochrome c biogenesis permease subunit
MGTLSLTGAVVFLTIFFGLLVERLGSLPLGAPGFDALLLGYLLTVALLVFDLRYHLPFLRAYLTAVVVGIFFLATFLIGTVTLVTTTGERWLLGTHIVTILLSTALYLLASGLALLYLRSHERLKRHCLVEAGAPRTPLERLDRLGRVAALAAFVVLTLSILSGAAYARTVDVGDDLDLMGDPLVVTAGVLWLYMAAVSILRLTHGLSRRRAAQLTLLGCVVLLLVVLVLRGGVHR